MEKKKKRKKIERNLLEIPDHLHTLPHFLALEKNAECQALLFYDTQGKTFIYVGYCHALASHYLMQLPPD